MTTEKLRGGRYKKQDDDNKEWDRMIMEKVRG
jgi:hypothetical protein